MTREQARREAWWFLGIASSVMTTVGFVVWAVIR